MFTINETNIYGSFGISSDIVPNDNLYAAEVSGLRCNHATYIFFPNS